MKPTNTYQEYYNAYRYNNQSSQTSILVGVAIDIEINNNKYTFHNGLNTSSPHELNLYVDDCNLSPIQLEIIALNLGSYADIDLYDYQAYDFDDESFNSYFSNRLEFQTFAKYTLLEYKKALDFAESLDESHVFALEIEDLIDSIGDGKMDNDTGHYPTIDAINDAINQEHYSHTIENLSMILGDK